MNLSDDEILGLNELCSAAVDGRLTEVQRERLAGMLRESEEARKFYVRAMGLSASLHYYAGEMQAEAPDAAAPRAAVIRPVFWWSTFGALIAACLALMFWVGSGRSGTGDAPPPGADDYVARLTGSKQCLWNAQSAPQSGDRLRKGQRLDLASGFAEVTFDSGARVVLEGPASLDIGSAWDATLRRGAIKATVPSQAVGFRISNPAVEVVDLGTEFSMVAHSGTADVLVLKGEVEASPRSASDADGILLRADESLRFALSGVSQVGDGDREFAVLSRPVSLEHFAPLIHYLHWSFGEVSGNVARADVDATPQPAFDAHLFSTEGNTRSLERAVGPRGGSALHFDGRFYAKARFPGLSGSAAHTIAFWVRVPEDAQLSDHFTMVGWKSNVGKLRMRPVHINWNRDPNEGAVGALRTDFGGGYAMGTTSLRDGRWHFITVYFAPGENPDMPVQVRQYVDGRLETGAMTPSKVRAPVGTSDPAMNDIVWLGCRVGPTGLRKDHFRGDIADLYIADRGLEPDEIVALMTYGRMPPGSVIALSDGRPGSRPAQGQLLVAGL